MSSMLFEGISQVFTAPSPVWHFSRSRSE